MTTMMKEVQQGVMMKEMQLVVMVRKAYQVGTVQQVVILRVTHTPGVGHWATHTALTAPAGGRRGLPGGRGRFWRMLLPPSHPSPPPTPIRGERGRGNNYLGRDKKGEIDGGCSGIMVLKSLSSGGKTG